MATPRDPFVKIDSLISYRISQLSNRLALGASRLYGQRFGLVTREWRAIAMLAQYAPISASDIAKRLGLDKASVSRAVANLTRRGLMRTRRDATDTRVVWLEITAKGKQLYQQISPLALERQRQLLSSLTVTDRATLERLLDELTEQADRMNAALEPQGESPNESPKRRQKR